MNILLGVWPPYTSLNHWVSKRIVFGISKQKNCMSRPTVGQDVQIAHPQLHKVLLNYKPLSPAVGGVVVSLNLVPNTVYTLTKIPVI